MANLDSALQNSIGIRGPFQFKGFTHRCRRIASGALFIADDLETVVAYILNEAGNPCGRTTQATDMGHCHPIFDAAASRGSYRIWRETHCIRHKRSLCLYPRISAIYVVFFISVVLSYFDESMLVADGSRPNWTARRGDTPCF